MRKRHLITAITDALLAASQITIQTEPFKLVLAVIANSLFWIGLLQIDSMFWTYAGYHRMCEVYWIPEFAGTRLDWLGKAKNSFFLFCGAIIVGFYIFLGLMVI